MVKIAFLGCDSTHTEAFAECVNKINAPFYGVAKVVSIFGDSFEQSTEKSIDLSIDRVALTIEDALKNVDLAMVIGRFGDSHYEPVLKCLQAGIPIFVDKPFTISHSEAIDMVDISNRFGVPMTSSSPLRFSKEVLECKNRILNFKDELLTISVSVPANCTDLGSDPRLNSPFFYGIHGIEILLELIGYDVDILEVSYNDISIITKIERKNDKKIFLFQMFRDASEFYWIDIHTKTESFHSNIILDGSYYNREIDYILNGFFKGKELIPLESTLQAIYILELIEKGDLKKKWNE